MITETKPPAQIIVASELRKPHPLVKQVVSVLKSMKPGHRALIEPHVRGAYLDVRVSKATIHRALLIMDALLKSFIELGWCIQIRPRSCNKKGYATTLVVDGVEVVISLHERCRQIRTPISEEERRTWEQYWPGVEHRRHTVELEPTGELYLSLGNIYMEKECCKDGRRAKLEQKLDVFIIAIKEEVADEKRRNEEREQAEQARLERIAAERQLTESREREQQRLTQLHQQCHNWQSSQKIHGFVDAVLARMQAVSLSEEDTCRLENWSVWARAQADRLDPIMMLLGEQVGAGMPAIVSAELDQESVLQAEPTNSIWTPHLQTAACSPEVSNHCLLNTPL